ncbi:MAG: ribonuclease P protein component [Acetivibrionales bacterium]|jgi:ribonuclease P protein component
MKKTVTIKKNHEFARIYKKGKFFAGRYLVIYVLKNRLGVNRLGITVNKKAGKSVRRNRIKRLIRESYRLYEEFIPESYDIIFFARNTEAEYTYKEITKEMKFLLKKVQVFDQEKWDGLKKS